MIHDGADYRILGLGFVIDTLRNVTSFGVCGLHSLEMNGNPHD